QGLDQFHRLLGHSGDGPQEDRGDQVPGHRVVGQVGDDAAVFVKTPLSLVKKGTNLDQLQKPREVAADAEGAGGHRPGEGGGEGGGRGGRGGGRPPPSPPPTSATRRPPAGRPRRTAGKRRGPSAPEPPGRLGSSSGSHPPGSSRSSSRSRRAARASSW